jgi:hypothetical protein
MAKVFWHSLSSSDQRIKHEVVLGSRVAASTTLMWITGLFLSLENCSAKILPWLSFPSSTI